MSVTALPGMGTGTDPGWTRRVAGGFARGAVRMIRSRAPAVSSHLRDHIYSVGALGFISAAAYVHSLFAGLLVTGILLFIFEWKVSD